MALDAPAEASDPDGPDQANRGEANCGAAASRREAASNLGDGLLR